MNAPTKHTRQFEIKRHGDTVACAYYKIYGGEVEGFYTYCDYLKDWKWISIEQLSEFQAEKIQNEVNAHLDYLKNVTIDDNGPEAA